MRYKNRLSRLDAALSRKLAQAADKAYEWMELLSREELDTLFEAEKEFERSQSMEALERWRALMSELRTAALQRERAPRSQRAPFRGLVARRC
jgi:uncharacterized protein YdaT